MAGLISGCESIDMPQGTSAGYRSAKLVKPDPTLGPVYADKDAVVHGMIQKSLAKEFRSAGFAVGQSDAELVVAYLPIIQDGTSTKSVSDYFGQGRNSGALLEEAHRRGVLEAEGRQDFYEAGTLVVDVIDARTGELVYRNFATRPVVPGTADAVRQARIDRVVAEALADFFE